MLEPDDLSHLPTGYEGATYEFHRNLDNSARHHIVNGPPGLVYDLKLSKEFARMAAYVDKHHNQDDDTELPSAALSAITRIWDSSKAITSADVDQLSKWLQEITPLINDEDALDDERHTRILETMQSFVDKTSVLKILEERLPVFVLFNNYFRVKPSIHLDHLATRLESNILDDDQYDYGNSCLLKLLGFEARELSNLGKVVEPRADDFDALKIYKDQLDRRRYLLNAASVRLTNEIRSVWNPNPQRAEADRLRVDTDMQYLKVVVEDDLGVEIELDQRSEGFQWIVSFFVVFFAETADKHENAILLLDEPGLSLHGLKQRDFRATLSRLAEKNQTLYTTHSPFLVGPEELDSVRVVEMVNRTTGTLVHTSITAEDPASLLPLQEALGYDLAQSLFAQQRNLVFEGLTDHWYLDGTSQLLRAANVATLSDRIALHSADGAGKVVYYATILHANNLKVAALLDSDSAGDAAAKQETLVHRLGNRNILRTKDVYKGPVGKPEVEDLLRDTLILVGRDELGWDVTAEAGQQQTRPIVDVFSSNIKEFSKYKLAKAYLRWTRTHDASDLTSVEREQWATLIKQVNRVLK